MVTSLNIYCSHEHQCVQIHFQLFPLLFLVLDPPQSVTATPETNDQKKGATQPNIPCLTCDKKLGSREDWHAHEKGCMRGTKKITCGFCDKEIERSRFIEHSSTHFDDKMTEEEKLRHAGENVKRKT